MLWAVVDNFARVVGVIGAVSGVLALVVAIAAATFARGEARAVQANHRPVVKFASYRNGNIYLDVASEHPIRKLVVSYKVQDALHLNKNPKTSTARFKRLPSGTQTLTVVPNMTFGGSEVELKVRVVGTAFGRWTEPLTFNLPKTA